VKIFASGEPFGIRLVNAYHTCLWNRIRHGKIRLIYEGFGPYLVASAVVNIDYLIKRTSNFIYSILSKIPSPPSLEHIDEKPFVTNHDLHALAHSTGIIPGIATSFPPKKDKQQTHSSMGTSWLFPTATTAITTLVSHPALVVATHMVANPLCTGSPWLIACIKVMTEYGVGALYRGLK
jgi:hypothetical protein